MSQQTLPCTPPPKTIEGKFICFVYVPSVPQKNVLKGKSVLSELFRLKNPNTWFLIIFTHTKFPQTFAATRWNSLNVRDRGNRIRGSPSLESFKSNLKTLLFKEHFYPFSS